MNILVLFIMSPPVGINIGPSFSSVKGEAIGEIRKLFGRIIRDESKHTPL